MKFLLQVLKGALIGAGAILPGISSGVLCVMFGLYEKLIESILGFFKDIKKNFKFLFPILLGIVLGVVVFGNALNYVYSNFHSIACFCFIGLILGSIPSIFKEAGKHSLKIINVICLVLTLSFSLYLISIEFLGNVSSVNTDTVSFIELVFSGFAMSAGVVIPGVSSTVILMILGKYSLYLSAISSLNINILFPMGIGLVLGGIILLFMMKLLFEYFHSITYYAIIGFVLGSIFVLFPTNYSFYELISGVILGLICCLLAFYIQKKTGK